VNYPFKRLISQFKRSLKLTVGFKRKDTDKKILKRKEQSCKYYPFHSACVALFNLKCNLQNDNAICKMALHFVFNFTFYITILATFGALQNENEMT